jgi:hypothetical protein
VLRIRLTRKLAASLNGVDLSALNVGDVIEMPDAAARMLVAERWAELVADPVTPPNQKPSEPASAT